MTRSVIGSFLVASFLLVGCPASDQRRGVQYAPDQDDPQAPRGLTSEQLEEIKRVERIGNSAIVDCYTDEMERQNTKKIQGAVTVKVLIGTNGKAQEVQIARSTLNAPQVHQCMQQVIRSWDFPTLNAPTWYGTTFSFTPAY